MSKHLGTEGATATQQDALSRAIDETAVVPERKRHEKWVRPAFAVILFLGFRLALSLWLRGAAVPDGGDALVEEDFASKPFAFSTDSDRFVDLSVMEEEYRITLKDAQYPQVMRSFFDHSYDGVTIEATIVLPADRGDAAIAAVGCWGGNSAYMLAMTPHGSSGLIETVNEATGERFDLTGGAVFDVARPAGEPNRLRIDCVGGGHDATIVSAYLNGAPIYSVAIPEGFDSFSAAGLWVGAVDDGAIFTVDDVKVSAGRPAPGLSPSPAASTPL